MKLTHLLMVVALLSLLAGTGAVFAAASAAPAPVIEPTAAPPEADASEAAQFLGEIGLPQPIFVDLTPCEQECFHNEWLCLRVCYRGCGTSIPCLDACDANCAWASNACMCDCGSPLCNP